MHKYKLLFFNSWGKTVPYHTMLWLWLPISLLREKSFWIWFLSFDSRTKDGDHHCRCNTYLSVLLFIMLGSLFVKKLISVLKCSKLATQVTGRQMQAFRPGKSRVKNLKFISLQMTDEGHHMLCMWWDAGWESDKNQITKNCLAIVPQYSFAFDQSCFHVSHAAWWWSAAELKFMKLLLAINFQ